MSLEASSPQKARRMTRVEPNWTVSSALGVRMETSRRRRKQGNRVTAGRSYIDYTRASLKTPYRRRKRIELLTRERFMLKATTGRPSGLDAANVTVSMEPDHPNDEEIPSEVFITRASTKQASWRSRMINNSPSARSCLPWLSKYKMYQAWEAQ